MVDMESQSSTNQELYDDNKKIAKKDYIQNEMDKYSDEEFYSFCDFAETIKSNKYKQILSENKIKVIQFEYHDNVLWKELLNNLPKSTEILYLQHDGIIGIDCNDENKFDTLDDVKAVINQLPNLRIISYCGYYSKFNEENFKNVFSSLNRNPEYLLCNPIY